MWKPDELSADSAANNVAFATRNFLLYGAGGGLHFSACIPLKVIFNFCCDYNKECGV